MTDPLLPGELRAAPDGRRSPRDWLVDVALFLFAALVGMIVLADTWPDHGTFTAIVDVRGRRRLPARAVGSPVARGRGRGRGPHRVDLLRAVGRCRRRRAVQRGGPSAAPQLRADRRALGAGR